MIARASDVLARCVIALGHFGVVAATAIWAVLRNRRVRCVVCTVGAAGCFAAGLALPFVHVAPGEKLGPLEGLLVWLISDDDTYSLFGSIVAIWDEHSFLGALAFAFSIVLPSLKMLILSLCALLLTRDVRHIALYRAWAERLGPWSMLEVFLVAFTLLLTKSLPFGTAIHPLSGFYFFWSSITLSLVAAYSLPRCDRDIAASENTVPAAQAADRDKGTPNREMASEAKRAHPARERLA